IMGLWANYPIALAPGMGLNAYFAFGVVGGMGIGWQTALGAVFISGVLFFLLSIFKVREWIINAIPMSLKLAISAGIGLFLGIIALNNAGIVVDHPATLVTLGDVTQPSVILAALGFVLIGALYARRIPGAIVISILVVTVVGVVIGLTEFKGVAAPPPSMAPTLLQMDIAGALNVGLISIVFVFLFVDLFDTAGTLVGVSHRAGLLDRQGKLPRLGRALTADSGATMVGAAMGTSTTTSYIESASGINAGGRTGLTAVTVAVLFIACIFLAPLAGTVPAFATAPALLFVACLMARGMAELDWDDVTEYAPAVVCAVTMPLTYSIAHGIGIGFITYAAIKALSGKAADVGPAVWVIAAAFLVKFAVL
ncbi:MAG: NCS2 family permease, partial [Minwuiales bacterium]|nr:NCS2 family permease [Minwuiales bacterium]